MLRRPLSPAYLDACSELWRDRETVPTPDSAAAFAKLVAARTRLADVTKLINECYARLAADGPAGKQRYAQLQTEWDEAFQAFQDATGEFTVTMNRLREEVDAHRLPKA